MHAQALIADGRAVVVDETPDGEVVARCLDGQHDAFRQLVERYGDLVYRTVYLMTHDRTLAEDLTQETFAHAWRGLETFRRDAAFRPWLMRIAANRVVSHRRRRLLAIVPLAWGERRASESASPEERLRLAEDRDEMRDAIATLPHAQRQAVVLRYYAEMSVPEIAQATGWREGTVKSRLHRALARLRSLLEPAREE